MTYYVSSTSRFFFVFYSIETLLLFRQDSLLALSHRQLLSHLHAAVLGPGSPSADYGKAYRFVDDAYHSHGRQPFLCY